MNTLVTNLNGEKFGAWFPDTFDRVLLDAPCSMDNLRESAGRGRRSVSDRERQGLAGRQVNLLASAAASLKPGGQVVYSTCTLAPEEDEGVIDSLLRMFPGKIRLDDVSSVVRQPAPGLTGDGSRPYSPELVKSLRLWPHIYGTSGFFATRLTKLDSISFRSEEPPLRTFSRLGLESVSRHAQAAWMDRFSEAYGFDLQKVMDEQGLIMRRRENTLLALPERYLADFASFPVQQPGFPLFDETREGMIVSHELAARFGLQFTRNRHIIDAESRQAWLRGTDLLHAGEGDYALNTIVIVVDGEGRYLGRGKVLRDRIKNMIPRRLALN
jgi:16S rRNA (cytosine1407-C5)-methyltransferase